MSNPRNVNPGNESKNYSVSNSQSEEYNQSIYDQNAEVPEKNSVKLISNESERFEDENSHRNEMESRGNNSSRYGQNDDYDMYSQSGNKSERKRGYIDNASSKDGTETQRIQEEESDAEENTERESESNRGFDESDFNYPSDREDKGNKGEQDNDEEDEDEEESSDREDEQSEGDNPDDDFPEYANEVNKVMNKNIIDMKKKIKALVDRIDDYRERYVIIKEHYENITSEIKNTQNLIDVKNKEVESEKHHNLILDRKIGKLKMDYERRDNNIKDIRDKLNDLQQKIFEGNQKLEKLKIEINWNQEEMEIWLKAVKQKEEDKMTIEKYKRADDLKIKELSLDIERLTGEKNKLEAELKREITETQAIQVELEKVNEEFKEQNESRYKLYEQWDSLIKKIADKNAALLKIGNKTAGVKHKIIENDKIIKESQKELKRAIKNNHVITKEMKKLEKTIYEKKKENKELKTVETNLKAEIKILQNKLSAYSTELNNNKKTIIMLEQDLSHKRKRLAMVEDNYDKQNKNLQNEKDVNKRLGDDAKASSDELNKQLQEQNETNKMIQFKKSTFYSVQKDLYKLKEKESNLITEINGITSSIKNLTTHSNRLFADIQKQQELLYNAEYQIQLLERKVARAHGERSIEETDYLVSKIKVAKEHHSKAKQKFLATQIAMKQLEDEHRALEKRIKKLQEDEKKYVTLIEKINLENDMTTQDVNNVIKKKEALLVQNNIMKLEIQKIQNKVLQSHNSALQLENQKSQLELSMTEKEKEIQVHYETLKAEQKFLEQEKHKVAVELAERNNKMKNLEIKYKSLIQSQQGNVNINEHSQAYYIIKAAQQREEYERKNDEFQAQINKADMELKSLNNTLAHLKSRNGKFRDYHINKNATKEDHKLKADLENQFNEIGNSLVEKKKEMQNLRKMLETNENMLRETEQKLNFMKQKKVEVVYEYNNCEKELQDKEMKFERAAKTLFRNENLLKKKGLEVDDQSEELLKYKILIQENVMKTLNSLLK